VVSGREGESQRVGKRLRRHSGGGKVGPLAAKDKEEKELVLEGGRGFSLCHEKKIAKRLGKRGKGGDTAGSAD